MILKNKGNIPLLPAVIILLIAVAVAGVIIFVAQKKQGGSALPEENVPPISVNRDIQPEKRNELKGSTAGWVTYRTEDKKIEFQYPSEKLTLSQNKNEVVLRHSVPFTHTDPCDMRDGAKALLDLTDFKVSFQYLKQNLGDSVVSGELAFFVKEYLDGNALKVTPGYIDNANFGTFTGYKITNSVEGCGEYVYYFVLDPKNTLRVSRSIVTEFQPILTDYRENLKIPGIIEPREEEKLFNQIISTLKFTSTDISQ
ncbi:MAG: hypothetical protein L0Y73_08920 [Candidatus Aminicenantes bacterium]|nr:hypothetical protein [Candidatus Aminicenantes bacterium]